MYSWLERATAAGLAGGICSRNSPKVPSQRCARCKRLKELRDSMKPARLAVRELSAVSSEESCAIVTSLPYRFIHTLDPM